MRTTYAALLLYVVCTLCALLGGVSAAQWYDKPPKFLDTAALPAVPDLQKVIDFDAFPHLWTFDHWAILVHPVGSSNDAWVDMVRRFMATDSVILLRVPVEKKLKPGVILLSVNDLKQQSLSLKDLRKLGVFHKLASSDPFGPLSDTIARRMMLPDGSLSPENHPRLSPPTVHALLPTYQYVHAFSRLARQCVESKVTVEDMEGELSKLTKQLAATVWGFAWRTHAEEYGELLMKVVSEGWYDGEGGTEAKAEAEMAKARKLLRSDLIQNAKPKKRKQWTRKLKRKLYRLRTLAGEQVPRVVHFIKTDGRRDNFNIMHYLAVRTAHKYLKPDKIKFWTATIPDESEWFQKARPYLEIEYAEPPHYAPNGNPLQLAAHQSDFLRLDILLKEGGIYMDWDVITLRSFDELLNSNGVVFGVEAKVPHYNEVLGVAVMISRPNEPFLRRFNKEMGAKFDGASCYACHSTGLGKDLALAMPDKVNVLDYSSFYYPGWDEAPMNAAFDGPVSSSTERYQARRERNPQLRSRNGLDPKWGRGWAFAAHLFESHKNFVRILPKLTPEYIRTVDTPFNVFAREFFPEEHDEL